MTSEWEDAEREINSGTGSFYKPNQIPVGESEEITIVHHVKWTDTKYPIKDKEGNSLGYTWRFRLEDGRVWDVANRNRKILIAALHPTNKPEIVPHRFKITNLGKVIDKNPAVTVQALGPVLPDGTVRI